MQRDGDWYLQKPAPVVAGREARPVSNTVRLNPHGASQLGICGNDGTFVAVGLTADVNTEEQIIAAIRAQVQGNLYLRILTAEAQQRKLQDLTGLETQ